MNRLCEMVGVSRAGYYRFLLRAQRPEADMELRSQIQSIALRWPAYGYRRIQAELERQGSRVNHKCVLRLMRVDNLLCLRRRKFILTTDSKHGLPIYSNLAKDMRLTGLMTLYSTGMRRAELCRLRSSPYSLRDSSRRTQRRSQSVGSSQISVFPAGRSSVQSLSR